MDGKKAKNSMGEVEMLLEKMGKMWYNNLWRLCGENWTADNERGDDVGGCTFSWEFRRSMSGLKSGGEELQKTRASLPFVVKVSGCPEN